MVSAVASQALFFQRPLAATARRGRRLPDPGLIALEKIPARFTARRVFSYCVLAACCGTDRPGRCAQGIVFLGFCDKKQGAAGITTAAPRISGQWGRGDNRAAGITLRPESRSRPRQIF